MNRFLFLLFLLTICNCANDPRTSQSDAVAFGVPAKETSTTTTSILIFKKEKKIEFRKPNQKPSTHFIELDPNYPIGVFQAKKANNKIEINFPNEFYGSKNYQLDFESEISIPTFDLSTIELGGTLIYVFPNDARNTTNGFVADFSSPHWKSEIYAKMEFHLKEFN